MKKTINLLLIFIVLLSCKPKEQTINITKVVATVSDDRIIGKISHQYHKAGCATVIVITIENKKHILMPINPLDPLIDIDGLEVAFTYVVSRKVQTKDCVFSIPVIIKDLKMVEKK